VAFLLDVAEIREAEERALHAERLAAVGEAMTGLVHEGRNALQRAQSSLEMLALRVKDHPDALDLLAPLQRAQDDLLHLYEEVREYAAPIRLARRHCDLAEVWCTAWADLAPFRQDRKATIREERGDLDLHLLAAPPLLIQVFRNLRENALAAVPDPVEVVLRAEKYESEGRPGVRLFIRANGPGLKPEHSRRAFDAFYTAKTKGTGLGLPITRRIVEAHAGQLAIRETSGLGAEFQLLIPISGP
jgi:signal transduction histidine kinase